MWALFPTGFHSRINFGIQFSNILTTCLAQCNLFNTLVLCEVIDVLQSAHFLFVSYSPDTIHLYWFRYSVKNFSLSGIDRLCRTLREVSTFHSLTK